jgi:hypothetical protein
MAKYYVELDVSMKKTYVVILNEKAGLCGRRK